jgi:hypothetical protein
MKYQCDKGHTFMFPIISHVGTETCWVESHQCPYCKEANFNITEYTEPTQDVSNVYIFDLTSGPQTALDDLLAQGYKIVNRYAKAYHLEKCKPKPAETFQEVAEVTQSLSDCNLKEASEFYSKIPEKAQP